ncbi:AraC-like DNA-binding protein [Actinocorallia herbida]|uniref:AraC-like DNA-binding protein n=1 Tax=Actinocorallia herbida TaxID=58109 RepID=A0A3N1CX42_9ACTN|nr:AraC family transcriptional regulator [Actinocorallia herbida]ROO85857.1 AraC-like DNA-binding protein [Actinocorallia herbida]
MCHPGWSRALIAAQRLKDFARLRRVRDTIDREYARPLDLVELARAAGMPAGSLSREFRVAYGVDPYGYLMRRRVAHAAALLRHSEHSAAEVCFAVGCTSPALFDALFTELVGMTPAAFRRAERGPVRNREAPEGVPNLALSA